MKTIKELEEIEKSHPLNHFSRGYYQALNHVFKLIDELDFYGTDSPLSVLDKLKQKIQG